MNTSAGIGDPYLYEWTVGLEKVVSLLDIDDDICGVTLQSTDENVNAGNLDDVICEHEKFIEYIQVKHTRKNNPFGFSDLLGSDNGKNSLLQKLAASWKNVNSYGKERKVALLTNKKLVSRKSTIQGINLPNFSEFWIWLKKSIDQKYKNKEELLSQAPNKEYVSGITMIFEELDGCLDDKEILVFFRQFNLQSSYHSQDILDKNIITRFQTLFGVDEVQGIDLYQKLFYAVKQWASSTRESEKITKEEVYEKLSVGEQKYPETILLPPEPFFQSRNNLISNIEKEIKYGKNKVIFLYGKPGIGKTSLVNFLSQNQNSLIDFRYYAYTPITPESKVTSLDFDKNTIRAETMWGSLLNQLRSVFRGNLYKYGVPINNSFLNASELRKNVLRLASKYGEINSKKAVIVIDGIDHAARAGKTGNFLESLCQPEEIPENVVFVISGQPASDYKQYPIWLSPHNKAISSYKIEGVSKSDIKILLSSEGVDLADPRIVSEIIYDISKGNTLAAIFAIHESKNAKTVEELQSLLNKRKLSSGVEVYYESIWESRNYLQGYEREIADVLLPGLFLLSKEKINIREFSKIFDDKSFNEIQWLRLLNQYSPLIVNESGDYFLYHNDIRVFLEQKIAKEGIDLKNIASKMANYYMKEKSKIVSKHNDLFRLLDISERQNEKIEVFNAHFVKEALSVNQNLDILFNQFKEVCITIYEIKEKDLEKISDIYIVSMILNQYAKIKNRYDLNLDFQERGYYFSEYKKIYLNKITLTDIEQTLKDIKELDGIGNRKRTVGVLKKWFHNLHTIIKCASSNQKNKFKEKQLVKIIRNVSLYNAKYDLNIDFSWIKNNSSLLSSYVIGSYEGIVQLDDALKMELFLNKNKIQTLNNLNDILEMLFKQKKVDLLKVVVQQFSKNDTANNMMIFYEIILKKKIAGVSKFIEIVESPDFRNIIAKKSDALTSVKLSIIFGALQLTNYPKEKTITFLCNLCYEKNTDKRGKDYFKTLLSLGFDLGDTHYNSQKLEIDNIRLIFEKIRDGYNTNGWQHSDFREIRSLLEWFVLYYVQNLGEQNLENQMSEYLLEQSLSGIRFWEEFYEEVWLYLYDRGYDKELEEIFNLWMGAHGKAWTQPIEEMSSLYTFFTKIVNLLDNHQILHQNARGEFFNHLLGFVEHKDDVLNAPYMIFDHLSAIDPRVWDKQGIELMNISRTADRVGDNLLSNIIIRKIIERSMQAGPDDFMKFLNMSSSHELVIEYIDYIVSLLKKEKGSENDKLGVWFMLEAICDGLVLSSKKEISNYLNKIKADLSSDTKEIVEFRIEEIKQSYQYLSESPTPESSIDSTISTKERLSFQEMIDSLTMIINKNELRKTIVKLTPLLEQNRNSNYKKNKDILFSTLMDLDEGYSWQSQGLESSFISLIPQLSNQQNEKLFSHILNNTNFDREEEYWLSTLNENLLIYIIAMSDKSKNKLETFFNKIVNELTTWYDSSFKNEVSISSDGNAWLDIIEKLLWLVSSTNDINRTSASFNGLYFLFFMYPEQWNNTFIIDKTLVRQKELLLSILNEFVINGVNIDFSIPFLQYCINESKIFSLIINAKLVMSYKEKNFDYLKSEFGKKSEISDDISESGNKSLDDYIKRIGLTSFKKKLASVEEKYIEEYQPAMFELKSDVSGSVNFRQNDKKDFIQERYLNDELSGRGLLFYKVNELLSIDESEIMHEEVYVIPFDKKIFSLDLTNKESTEELYKKVQLLIEEEDTDIVGLTYTKMQDGGVSSYSSSFSILQKNEELDKKEFDNLSPGAVAGRGSIIRDTEYQFNDEHNPCYSLFNCVFGTTVYMTPFCMIPSKIFLSICKKIGLEPERKRLRMLNPDNYIGHYRYSNISIEVWTINKKVLNKYLINNNLELYKNSYLD